MKANSKLSIVLLLIFSFSIHSSAQSWQWINRMGGPNYNGSNDNPDEEVNCIVTDNVGNIYTCGRILPNCNFNGMIPDTTYGGDDIFLAKFDCEGNPLWVRTAGNPEDGDVANSLVLDASGFIYLTGFIEGDTTRPITFIDSVYYGNTTDMFIAKFDTSGNFYWVKIIGPGNVQIVSNGIKVAIDSYDRPCVITYAIGPGVFLPGYTVDSPGTYIVRFEPDGSIQKFIRLGDFTHESVVGDFKIGPDDSYYLTGRLGVDSLTLGGQTIHKIAPLNGSDLFLFKFDTSGIAQWNIHLGFPVVNFMKGNGIDFDAAGNILFTGDATNNIVIGSDTLNNSLDTVSGNKLPFISKITPQGQPLWAVNINCKYGFSSEGGIVVKSNGNSLISGFFSGPAKMGPDSFNSIGVHDVYMAEIDPNGNVLHGYPLNGSSENERALCMTRDWNDNIFVGGGFDGTLNYNGGSTTSAGGNTDGYIAKWGSSLCTVGIKETQKQSGALQIFPNPVQHTLYVNWNSKAGTTRIAIYNVLGDRIYSDERHLKADDNLIKIELPQLSSGLYAIVLEENGIRVSGKFLTAH